MLFCVACDEHTLTVYQAYSPGIAATTVAQHSLAVFTFKVEHIKWIKPSFLWMMYRSG